MRVCFCSFRASWAGKIKQLNIYVDILTTHLDIHRLDANEDNMADKSPACKRRKTSETQNQHQENAGCNNILIPLEAAEREMVEEAAKDVSGIQTVVGCNELQKDNNKEPEPNDPVILPTPTALPNEVDDFLSVTSGSSQNIGLAVATDNNSEISAETTPTLNQEQLLSPGSTAPTRTPTPTPNDGEDLLSAVALGNIFALHGISIEILNHRSRFFTSSDSDGSDGFVRGPSDFIIHNANNDDDDDLDNFFLSGLREAQIRMSHNSAVYFSDDRSSSSSTGSINDPSISSDSFDDENDPVSADVTNLVNRVIGKTKPAYTFNLTMELMQREHNNINRIGGRGGHTSLHSFNHGFYGSRQVVEQMTLLGRINHHRRCVNCLNFNRAGDLICSGSDDCHIAVWDWAKRKQLYKFKSGHTLNIFQTKFIDSSGSLDIVSTSRDGHVMRSIVPPSGATSIRSTGLYWHAGSVQKITLVPQTRHEMISAGEDAAIMHYDLRSNSPATTLLRCMNDANINYSLFVRLYSIDHHPYAPEFCVAGSDDIVRVYDKRKLAEPINVMAPEPKVEYLSQVTCAVYNYSGSEILASYKDAGIYLYDSRNCNGGLLHTYRGHINSRTNKDVNFFGPHSEYVVTGSDCGNIIFYDKNTEAIINYVKDDHNIVNCLEPHPWLPILATSGLDHDVKLWEPSRGSKTKSPYNTEALRKILTRNFSRQARHSDIDRSRRFDSYLPDPETSGSEMEDDGLLNDTASSGSSSSSTSSTSSNSSTPDYESSPHGSPSRQNNDGEHNAAAAVVAAPATPPAADTSASEPAAGATGAAATAAEAENGITNEPLFSPPP